MRILILTGIFPPEIGGPATYTEKLSKELAKKGDKIKIITYGKKGIDYPLPVFYVSKKWPKIIRHSIFLLKAIKESFSVDLIYSQNLFSVGIPGLIASKISGKKFLVKIVGDYVWEQSLRMGWFRGGIDEFQTIHSFRINLLKKIQKLVASKADIIITPSNYLKGLIIGWGVPDEMIKVIYNAAEEIKRTDLSKEEAKKEIGIEGDIIFSIGRLSPWKGFSMLVEVMGDLVKENDNLKLVIAGDGEERKNIEDKIKALNLEDNVFILGRVPHEKINIYFKASELFVLNTAYEGFPHVILEAMQSEVPVITTNKGGNVEVIENNVNGLLVGYNNREKWKDAILKIYKDNNLRNKFIGESKTKIKQFNWGKLVREVSEVLKSL
jgi:glycosyltransferase involved in cell wall biosynthesis